jgi:hypothetical protein
MFSRLISMLPWSVTLVLGVILMYFITAQQRLENKIETLKNDNVRMVEQRNAIISVNHSMHDTLHLMQQQLDEAQDTANWLSGVEGAMDSKLSKAEADIKRITDVKAHDVKGCNDSFSNDVYQWMLDAYRTTDSSKE